jgi:hypothetical protein
MTRIVLKSKVGADGMLQLTVPLGPEAADQQVQVTVEPLSGKAAMTQAEYAAWVESLAGTWQGEFERPPQGEFEERDPL